MNKPTNFQLVAAMNSAFGNPKGDSGAIDLERVKSQCKNILDEYNELMEAFEQRDFYKIRDALCDIHVFAYGAHHLMGLDADDDMFQVVNAVMSRFIKNEDDKERSRINYANKGVTEVYFEGNYPQMIMKSAIDQPDAPKDKFLKSASYREPTFNGICFEAFKKGTDYSKLKVGNWGVTSNKQIKDGFNPHNYSDWKSVDSHIWYSATANAYVFEDEANQFDDTPYNTEEEAAAALTNYVKNNLGT